MMTVREPVDFALEAHPCDCCGGRDVEEIWTNRYSARTRSAEYRFVNRNVVCRNCGFAFVSPRPRQDALDRYYADCFAHFAGQPASSDIATRVDYVRKHVAAGLDGIEIGGNRLVSDGRIRSHFRNFASVEPNQEIAAHYPSIEAVPAGSADVVMHYYVLEHAADPRAFLQHCHRILRPGGTMICEVPDLKLFPRFCGELLWWEHLSHFSVVSLARIAGACGFRIVDVGHRTASHERGFSAAFVRQESSAAGVQSPADAIEYADAAASMRDGLLAVEAFHAQLEATRAEIDHALAAGERVTLWGANEVMRRLLAPPYRLGPAAMVVDDDERKVDFLEGVTVRRPADVVVHLAASATLVIASSRLRGIIEARAQTLAGPAFAPAVRIVDYELLRSD